MDKAGKGILMLGAGVVLAAGLFWLDCNKLGWWCPICPDCSVDCSSCPTVPAIAIRTSMATPGSFRSSQGASIRRRSRCRKNDGPSRCAPHAARGDRHAKRLRHRCSRSTMAVC